jgi:SAM-dependent methyltransferase
MSIKKKVPWWLKIIIKSILYRIPISYSFWRNILFTHGDMHNPDYAYNIFLKHYQKVDISTRDDDVVALELGPGDSLYSALIGHAFGISQSYLVDVGNFASSKMDGYLNMAEYLSSKGYSFSLSKNISSINELLNLCNAEYLTSGSSSLKTIPDNSVDFIWSEAVLEHIRFSDFENTFNEIKRILKADGISSHRVDLRDHLVESINNLRFSEKTWESNFMVNSGFYTNRIRYSQMIEIFKQIGFNVETKVIETWDRLPVSRSKLSSEFNHLTDEDLCVSVFDVVLTTK